MEIIVIEDLNVFVSAFSEAQCDFLAESCIVALSGNKHVTGCVLKVIGDDQTEYALQWSKSFPIAGYKEKKKTTEHAAEAISFFLAIKLTEFTVIEEAVIGTGHDYWLGWDVDNPKYDPRNFLQARLEISGIDKENGANTIERRVDAKKRQTNRSDDSRLPAYVSVIEFATPKGHFSRK